MPTPLSQNLKIYFPIITYQYSENMSSTNKDKMLQAVLSDDSLMKLGEYSLADISNIYEALNSDNYVINVVAQIIMGANEGTTETELWRQISDYLKSSI